RVGRGRGAAQPGPPGRGGPPRRRPPGGGDRPGAVPRRAGAGRLAGRLGVARRATVSAGRGLGPGGGGAGAAVPAPRAGRVAGAGKGRLSGAGGAGASARVAAGGAAARALTPPARRDHEGPRKSSDPYLTRLLVSRVEAQTPAAAESRSPRPDAEGLADFELGKVLHRWEDGGRAHEVRWARQRSLDRAVRVWIDRGGRAGDPVVPGVVVRHPAVLVLHAVGTGPEGHYLVTEAVTGSPLAEAVQQRGLVPEEAAVLAARL